MGNDKSRLENEAMDAILIKAAKIEGIDLEPTPAELKGIFPFTKRYAAYTAKFLQDPEVFPCLPNQMKPSPEFTPDNEPLSKWGRLLLRRSDFVMIGVFLMLAGSFGCSLFTSQINRDAIGSFLKALSP